MKRLFISTAIIEAAAGAALVGAPVLVVRLLLGVDVSDAGLSIARVAGAALFAFGVACWLARDDNSSAAARGLTLAMLIYNIGVMAVLVDAATRLGLHGVALIPGVILHLIMSAWCVVGVRRLALPK